MDWHHYVKKYVWDEKKTPYFVSVSRLTRGQAKNEIFIYALFIGVPAMLMAVATTMSVLESGSTLSATIGIYSITLCVAAGLLHARKMPIAVYYSVSLPLILLIYLYLRQRNTDVALFDTLVFVAVMLLWLRYLFRLAAICKAYPGLPEARPEDAEPGGDEAGPAQGEG